MGITHHKVATLPDDPSAEVGKDEWNDEHDVDDITSLPTAEVDGTKVLAPDGLGGVEWRDETGGGGGGAPTTADYLVGTANASLSNEIAVGTTPGGELGGTWASPTVDATHSGSTHAATQAAAESTAASALSTHAAASDPHPGYVTTAEGTTLISDHAAAGDPHTGYRLESADHTHVSSGLQGGTVAYSAITGTPAAERAASSSTPAAVGTAAIGVGTTDARADHVHATGAGTPSTQAFGDAAATGTGPAAAMTDHKHAMPAAPTTVATDAIWTTVGKVARATGTATATEQYPPGHQFDRVAITAQVVVSGTAEGTPTTIITGGSVTYDGSTEVEIEVNLPRVALTPSAAGHPLIFIVLEGSTLLGRIAVVQGSGATDPLLMPVRGSIFRTPTSGSKQYFLKAYQPSGDTASVDAGAGGSGNQANGWMRVRKA